MEKISEENMNHIDGLIYLTGSGLRVRSKSERTITDALDQNKIIYRYEETLKLGNVIFHPDFTVYRPSDGKVFLWEHLGLMNQNEYRNKTIEKLSLYARYGFLPFDNMIFTFEQDLLNPACIHSIIEVFLLQ